MPPTLIRPPATSAASTLVPVAAVIIYKLTLSSSSSALFDIHCSLVQQLLSAFLTTKRTPIRSSAPTSSQLFTLELQMSVISELESQQSICLARLTYQYFCFIRHFLWRNHGPWGLVGRPLTQAVSQTTWFQAQLFADKAKPHGTSAPRCHWSPSRNVHPTESAQEQHECNDNELKLPLQYTITIFSPYA